MIAVCGYLFIELRYKLITLIEHWILLCCTRSIHKWNWKYESLLCVMFGPVLSKDFSALARFSLHCHIQTSVIERRGVSLFPLHAEKRWMRWWWWWCWWGGVFTAISVMLYSYATQHIELTLRWSKWTLVWQLSATWHWWKREARMMWTKNQRHIQQLCVRAAQIRRWLALIFRRGFQFVLRSA